MIKDERVCVSVTTQAPALNRCRLSRPAPSHLSYHHSLEPLQGSEELFLVVHITVVIYEWRL